MEQTKVKFEFTPHSAYGQQLDIFAEYVRQKNENAIVGLLLSTVNDKWIDSWLRDDLIREIIKTNFVRVEVAPGIF